MTSGKLYLSEHVVKGAAALNSQCDVQDAENRRMQGLDVRWTSR